MMYFEVGLHYGGQRSPVHAGAADVEMLPVDNPERRLEEASGEGCHVHLVNLSACKIGRGKKKEIKVHANKRQKWLFMTWTTKQKHVQEI